MVGVFDGLLAEIATVRVAMSLGRVSEVAGGTVLVSGLVATARQGDRVMINGTPVSYTHLDVYKRQPIGPAFQ